MSKEVKLIYAVTIAALLFFAAMIATGHASTAPVPNSLGAPQEYSDTNAYMMALPIGWEASSDITSIHFRPYNTPMVYTKTITFCGDVRGEFFDSKDKMLRGVLVIAYDSVSHRKFDGASCHDLLGVFQVQETK